MIPRELQQLIVEHSELTFRLIKPELSLYVANDQIVRLKVNVGLWIAYLGPYNYILRNSQPRSHRILLLHHYNINPSTLSTISFNDHNYAYGKEDKNILICSNDKPLLNLALPPNTVTHTPIYLNDDVIAIPLTRFGPKEHQAFNDVLEKVIDDAQDEIKKIVAELKLDGVFDYDSDHGGFSKVTVNDLKKLLTSDQLKWVDPLHKYSGDITLVLGPHEIVAWSDDHEEDIESSVHKTKTKELIDLIVKADPDNASYYVNNEPKYHQMYINLMTARE